VLCAGQVYEAKLQVGDGSIPAGGVSLNITLPGGKLLSPAPAPVNNPPGSGIYTYDYTLPAPGLYQFAWVTTGPGTAPFPEFVNVRRYASIVSMAEMKDHLNKSRVKAGSDDEMAAFMMAATELVEDKIGICVPRQFTDRVSEGRLQLVVPNRPILSVQSVTSQWAGGPSWADPGDGTVLAADSEAGLIYQPSMMEFWWGPWDAVYTCGRAEIREPWIHAAKEQCRHLWETQRGSMAPALLQGEEVFSSTQGFSFSVPRRVLELLEGDLLPSV
jgi:hypothetical protein